MLFACGFTAYVHGGGSRELVGISATTPELTGKANFPHDLENSDLKGQCVVCAEENNFLNFDQNILEKLSHARRNMPIKRARERPEKILNKLQTQKKKSVNAKAIFTPRNLFFISFSF